MDMSLNRPASRFYGSTQPRQNRLASFVTMALVAGTNLAAGCMDGAYTEVDTELASSAEPECRSRIGILWIENTSGRDIARIWLRDLDADGDFPATELAVKDRGDSRTWYEILFLDCGPKRTDLHIEFANGEVRHAELTSNSRSINQVVITPAGIR
jgi:hypothetical protein